MTLLRKLTKEIKFAIEYYIIQRTNKVAYLRQKGASIGKNCDIITAVRNFGSEPYLIHMGDNVTITHGVILLTHDGATRVFRSMEAKWKKGMGVYGCIDIGDNVFIGVNSIILPGVSIGSNVVIGAGSVVTKKVPSNVVIAGNPAKVIRPLSDFIENSLRKATVVDTTSEKRRRKELSERSWGQ